MAPTQIQATIGHKTRQRRCRATEHRALDQPQSGKSGKAAASKRHYEVRRIEPKDWYGSRAANRRQAEVGQEAVGRQWCVDRTQSMVRSARFGAHERALAAVARRPIHKFILMCQYCTHGIPKRLELISSSRSRTFAPRFVTSIAGNLTSPVQHHVQTTKAP